MTNSKYKVLIVEDDPMVAQINRNYTEKILMLKLFLASVMEKKH